MAAGLFTVRIQIISFSYNNLTLCKRWPLSSDVDDVKLCRNKNKNSCHLFVSSVSVCRHYLLVLAVTCWLIALTSGLNEKIQVMIVVGE